MARPAPGQVVRVAVGDREVARATVSDVRGYPALPVTLLVPLGVRVDTVRGGVVVLLFDDTLHFRPGHAGFRVNGQLESLHSWTHLQDGVLFVAQWFFTSWLPRRYPGRFSYGDGVLRLASEPGRVVRRPNDDATAAVAASPVPPVVETKLAAPTPPTGSAALAGRDSAPRAAAPPRATERPPAKDTARARPAPQHVDEELPLPIPQRGGVDPLRGVLLGFIDARVSGVFDSNIDHDPVARPSYGTVARLGVGIQSSRARPFLMARYDFALHRFVSTAEWNRSTHDASAELAPSFGKVRLRLGAGVRLGAWTEDRQAADQIILRPQIEFRPTPIHMVNAYVVVSGRRVDTGVETRSDTFTLAGVGYSFWWRGGGLRLDWRHEANASEYERSRYGGWTGRVWVRVPLAASHRLTLETVHNQRTYPHNVVGQAGSATRWDRRWTSSVALTSEFARALWELGLEYEIEDNHSNEAYAVYQAHRVEFTVRRRW